MASLTILNHPLAGVWVTALRNHSTGAVAYRDLTKRLTLLLSFEALKSIPTTSLRVTTPLEETEGAQLTRGVVVVPILRAGLSMVEGVHTILPEANVGYIGLERDEETAEASEYYCKLPPLTDHTILLTDPMLATGGSAVHALSVLRRHTSNPISLLSIIAAPEGVARVREAHPDVAVITAALDRELNDRKFICPGLGDFGDRLFGTTPDGA